MLALLGANPEAFSPPCNLYGILHVGAVLELPPAQQIAAVDAETARRIVEQQQRDWAAHRNSGRPLVCEPTPPAAPQPEVAQPSGAERPPSEERRPPEPSRRRSILR
jgi:Tfp pilus assembly protein FimV